MFPEIVCNFWKVSVYECFNNRQNSHVVEPAQRTTTALVT